MPKPWPINEYQEPPDDAFPPPQPPVTVPAAVVAATLATLNLLDEFLRRHASAATRAELQAFAALHGWEPVQGAETIIEGIGLDALSLVRARRRSNNDQPHKNSRDHPAALSSKTLSTTRSRRSRP